jgi:hypothetical protein
MLGSDRGYDAQDSVEACVDMKVTPHVARSNSGRRPAVPKAVARRDGHVVSRHKRKLIEQVFGCAKTVDSLRQVMVRGLKKVDQTFVLRMAAYHLVRMRTLGQIRAQVAQ